MCGIRRSKKILLNCALCFYLLVQLCHSAPQERVVGAVKHTGNMRILFITLIAQYICVSMRDLESNAIQVPNFQILCFIDFTLFGHDIAIGH